MWLMDWIFREKRLTPHKPVLTEVETTSLYNIYHYESIDRCSNCNKISKKSITVIPFGTIKTCMSCNYEEVNQ